MGHLENIIGKSFFCKLVPRAVPELLLTIVVNCRTHFCFKRKRVRQFSCFSVFPFSVFPFFRFFFCISYFLFSYMFAEAGTVVLYANAGGDLLQVNASAVVGT